MDWLSLGFIINSLGMIKFENAKFFLGFGFGGIAQVQLPHFHSHKFLLSLLFNFFFFFLIEWLRLKLFYFILLWISTIHCYCIKCNTPDLNPFIFVMFHVNIVKLHNTHATDIWLEQWFFWQKKMSDKVLYYTSQRNITINCMLIEY